MPKPEHFWDYGLLVRVKDGDRSPTALLVHELDAITGRLLGEYAGASVEDFYKGSGATDGEGILRWGEERGKAQGVCFALATITAYTMDEVREQIMRRAEIAGG